MAERQCIACGSAEKYLRAGAKCKACREFRAVCLGCSAEIRGRKRQYCSPRCQKRCSDTRRRRKEGVPKNFGARQGSYRFRHRFKAAAKRGYSGSIEEYADYIERVRMRCGGADGWKKWMPRPSRITQPPTRKVQHGPLAGHNYPRDWSAAMCYAYRIKYQPGLVQKERDRQRLKRFMDPRYAARHDKSSRWRKAIEQSGDLTRAHLRREMRERFCSYCGDVLTADTRCLDHVTPLSRGGRHADENIVACCQPCNSAKASSTPLEWLARQVGIRLRSEIAA
jgi:5-methylcytosine-specific restriction endonuclease McrA